MLIAQVNKQISILMNKTLRFEEIKNLTDLNFITYSMTGMSGGGKKKKMGINTTHSRFERRIIFPSVILDLIQDPELIQREKISLDPVFQRDDKKEKSIGEANKKLY